MKWQLTTPAALHTAMARFDAMSLRERALIGTAMLACLLVLWDTALMQPLNAKRAALLAIIDTDPNAIAPEAPSSETAAADTEAVTDADATGTALLQRESLRSHIAALDRQLQQLSAGLIEPERMSEVLASVLRQQHGVTLISLHNQPVRSLAPMPPANVDSNSDANGDANNTRQPLAGPYLHPVELVIEGRYLDILNYLHALEALPWRFNWQSLELDNTHTPLNRTRIEISTLSLDPAWIGT